MNLIDTVFSLELAKELYEIKSIRQNSQFFWRQSEDTTIIEYRELVYMETQRLIEKFGFASFNQYSAFSASELLELIPNRITLNQPEPFNSFRLRIEKSFIVDETGKRKEEKENVIITPIYLVNYYCDSTECTGENAWLMRGLFKNNIVNKNICNALAKTLIKINQLENENEIKNN